MSLLITGRRPRRTSNKQASAVELAPVEDLLLFECPFCPEEFSLLDSVEKHMRGHRHSDLPLAGDNLYQADDEPYQACEEEPQTEFVPKRDQLPRHTPRRTTKNLYDCPTCPAFFNTTEQLSRHVCCSFPQPKKRRFRCEHCPQSFSDRKSLHRHALKHTGEYPYFCVHCNARFAQRKDLASHAKELHCSGSRTAADRPFKCKQCPKSFARQYKLVIHTRSHPSDKPLLRCDHCQKSFSDRSNLARHKRLHAVKNSFRCNRCQKSFAGRIGLSNHKRVHAGEQAPISQGPEGSLHCEMCTAVFSYQSLLYRHMRLHTKEKPFECMLCYKAFPRKDYLTNHMLRQHKHHEQGAP